MSVEPEPASSGPSYAADSDDAERAAPAIGQPKIEITSRISKSAITNERLLCSSTAGTFSP